MLRFFRQIRKTLMEQNKARMYLLYAFGEILLVVIGILIALQVNNWNITRQDKAEEQQILWNLKSELEQAVVQLNYLNELRNNVTNTVDNLVKISNNDGPYVHDALDSMFVHLAYSPTFNDPTGSLTSLISSNKINLISNNELKVALLSWPRESEDMMEDERREVTLYDNRFRAFTLTHTSIADMLNKYKISDNQFNLSTQDMAGITPSKYVKSDYRKLLRNPEFINVLHTRSIFYEYLFT